LLNTGKWAILLTLLLFSGVIPVLFIKTLLRMAKIQLSAFLNQIRGSVSGSTFSKNHNGIYVKSKSNPINPDTTRQQLVRSQLSSVSKSWGSLTDEQREGWKNKAASEWAYQDALGETKRYSGNQLFNKLNMQLVTADLPLIEDAVSPADIDFVETINLLVELAVDGTLSIVEVTFAADAIGAGQTLIFDGSPAGSPGRDSASFKRKKVGSRTVVNDNYDITAEYLLAYGIPQVGEAVWVTPYIIDNATGTRLDLNSVKAVVTQAV
jgi:hypothetical protein